tara:strand:- start:1017 stop:1712 length:696 start_codon:yes stop_codon:yes gene_type:complete
MSDPKILVVEDEENIREAVVYSLSQEGFDVYSANDGEDGLNKARTIMPDLVLLDVMLPKLDGFEVCRMIRKDLDLPVFMLSAKGEEIDRVVGLELGADDYITKPFSMRELVVRIRNMLKRSSNLSSSTLSDDELIIIGNLSIDTKSHRVKIDNQEINLKPREFELLYLLASNQGKALSRHQILEKLWGHRYIGDIRTVDVHVRWIREKIEDDPSSPSRLVTIRGIGYRFDG